MKTKKVKIQITATDTVGREETIKLMVNQMTEIKLKHNEDTKEIIRDMIDIDNQLYGQSARYFSKSQRRKIENFFKLCYHKFYNYELSINVLN